MIFGYKTSILFIGLALCAGSAVSKENVTVAAPDSIFNYAIYFHDALKKFPKMNQKYKMQIAGDLGTYGWREVSLSSTPGEIVNAGSAGKVVVYEICRTRMCDTHRLTVVYNPATNEMWRRFRISVDDVFPEPPADIKRLLK